MNESIPSINSKTRFSGWWYCLAVLPIAFIAQTCCLTFFNRKSAGMQDAALYFDIFILIRSILGLVFHTQSKDWRIYLALEFLIIPIIWILAGFVSFLLH